jgi:hypothetical protein
MKDFSNSVQLKVVEHGSADRTVIEGISLAEEPIQVIPIQRNSLSPQKNFNLLTQVLDLFVGPGGDPALAKPLVADGGQTAVLISLSPTEELTSSLARDGYTHVHRFIVLPSRGAPRLLLPESDPGTTIAGTQVYAPYKRASRIMKGALLRVIRTGWSGWIRRKALVASKEVLPLERLVTEITGETNPIFSLSLGTQAAVRKLTVQVMRPRGEILGYIKLPLTGTAAKRVRHEAAILERLTLFPALHPQIPRLLYHGPWNEAYVLFQSPVVGEPGPTSFARMHEEFLDTLRTIQPTKRRGQNLIDEVGSAWGKVSTQLGARWQALAREVLHRAARTVNDLMLPCGVMHGDFTPWNTRTRDQRLILFDWESAEWEAPLGWDAFHFHVQTERLLNKRSGCDITSQGNGANGALYLLYLLNSVAQYVEEENRAAISHREQLIITQLSKEGVSVQ